MDWESHLSGPTRASPFGLWWNKLITHLIVFGFPCGNAVLRRTLLLLAPFLATVFSVAPFAN